MKIKEFDGYISLDCDNEYSALRYTKADIKLNNKRKRQYFLYTRLLTFLERIEENKRFKFLRNVSLNIKNRIIKSRKYDTLNHCYSYKANTYKSEIQIEQDDFVPKSIVIFDLLPKENVKDFSQKYIKFRERNRDKKQTFSVKSIKEIRDVFGKIATRFFSSSFYNIDHFLITEEHELSKYFSVFDFHACDLSPSFLCLSYTLTLNEKTKEIFGKIVHGNVFLEGHFIDRGTKNKYNNAYTIGGTGWIAKPTEIEDFVCELKSYFLKTLRVELMSKLDEFNIVLPSTTIYKCKNVSSMVVDNSKLKELFRLTPQSFYDKSKSVLIDADNCLFNHGDRKLNIYNAFIDASWFDSTGSGKRNEYSVYEQLHYYFSKYYIMDALLPVYNDRISKTNADINLMLQSKCQGFRKLIKLKKDSIARLTIFDRLLYEYLKIDNSVSIYEGAGFLCTQPFGTINHFSNLFEILDKNLSSSYDGLSQIFNFFEKQLKAIESHANYKTAVFSLWVAISSLIVAIITFLLTNDAFVSWLSTLFTK